MSSSATAVVVTIGFILIRRAVVVVVVIPAVLAGALVRMRVSARVMAGASRVALLVLLLCAVVRDLLHPFVGKLLCHIGNAVKQDISQRRHLCVPRNEYPNLLSE